MNSLTFWFLRRMRTPLLVLVSAYTISIAGLVLIPGVDPQGEPWQFSFFHAFYFVSYMGSTIGFGEIPYPFTDAQRMWTVVALYGCVISWLYAIGSILALLQDPAFRRVWAEQRFARRVQRLQTPFYIICGYGETGSLLVKSLSRVGSQSVVLDGNIERINELTIASRGFDIPSFNADAREVHYLQMAGLKHPRCAAVLALTSNDQVNTKIAVTSKLLRPELPVICRADSQDTAANMASFNTDHVINPYKVFADHLTMALRTPSVHLLYQWLTSPPNSPLPELIQPPRGNWIVCGFGRFGRVVRRYLDYEGIPTVVIEPDQDQAPEGAIVGRGTEAVTLREAGIDKAAGLVAGADNDVNNLSIVITAKQLNPKLYLVARQNRRANDAVFRASGPDLVMETSRILAQRVLPLLTTPLLSRFLLEVRHHNDEWAEDLINQLRGICDSRVPQIWAVSIDGAQAPAVCAALRERQQIKLGDLLRNPQARGHELLCVPLLLRHADSDKDQLLPAAEEALRMNDQLLLCAHDRVERKIDWLLNDPNMLEYVITGKQIHASYVWRWLARYWQKDGKNRKSKAEEIVETAREIEIEAD